MDSYRTKVKPKRMQCAKALLIALLVVGAHIFPLRNVVFGEGLFQCHPEGDINGDRNVDMQDIIILATYWLSSNCQEPLWCGGADLDHDTTVNMKDWVILSRTWNLPSCNILKYPTRLAQGADGRIYVTDAFSGSVFIYGADLKLISELKDVDSPLGVAVSPDGRIYIGSRNLGSVIVYDSSGMKIGSIGRGRIRMPNGLTLDQQGNLYVADSLSDTIRVYDPQGQWLRNIGQSREQGDFKSEEGNEGYLQFPTHVIIFDMDDGNGPQLYVADQGQGLVQVFDMQGNFQRNFGGIPTQGMMSWKWRGRFVRLQSLAFDPANKKIHGLDCYMNNVQIFNPLTGIYDSFYYGQFGTEEGQLNVPLDFIITDTGQVIVANSENKRVEVIYTIP